MDRRVYPRFDVQSSGAFTEDSRARQGMVADISVGGRTFQSDVQIPPGSYSKFTILLPGYKGLLTADRAEVRWCRDSATGIEFIRMAPDQQTVLRHVVEMLSQLDALNVVNQGTETWRIARRPPTTVSPAG